MEIRIQVLRAGALTQQNLDVLLRLIFKCYSGLFLTFNFFQVGKAEFLGRAVGRPSVQLCECDYKMPSLEWFQIYRGTEEAGELLATFEMFEVTYNSGFKAFDYRFNFAKFRRH